MAYVLISCAFFLLTTSKIAGNLRIDDIVEKPFCPKKLVNTLASLIESKELAESA